MTTVHATSGESLGAEPRWRDDAEMYLGPRIPVHLIALVVAVAALVALGITLAMGL